MISLDVFGGVTRMPKLPALQFYPGDWHKDVGVQSLDFFTRHVWFEMLLKMHESEEYGVLVLNGKPMTAELIAASIHLDNQIFEPRLTKILDLGIASRRVSDGAIYCRRMIRDETLRKLRRECGKMGGNPVLVNPVVNLPSGTEVNQIVEDEDEDEDMTLKKRGDSKGEKLPAALDVEPFKAAWAEWLRWRASEKHKKVTPTGQRRMLAQLEKMGVENAVRSIEQSLDHEWTGLFNPQPAGGNSRAPQGGRKPPPAAADRGEYAEPDRPIPRL